MLKAHNTLMTITQVSELAIFQSIDVTANDTEKQPNG